MKCCVGLQVGIVMILVISLLINIVAMDEAKRSIVSPLYMENSKRNAFAYLLYLEPKLMSMEIRRNTKTKRSGSSIYEHVRRVKKNTPGPGLIHPSGKMNVKLKFRHEQRHLNGTVTGSFGQVRPDGSVKIVHYVQDDKGYRELSPSGSDKSIVTEATSHSDQILQWYPQVQQPEGGGYYVRANPQGQILMDDPGILIGGGIPPNGISRSGGVYESGPPPNGRNSAIYEPGPPYVQYITPSTPMPTDADGRTPIMQSALQSTANYQVGEQSPLYYKYYRPSPQEIYKAYDYHRVRTAHDPNSYKSPDDTPVPDPRDSQNQGNTKPKVWGTQGEQRTPLTYYYSNNHPNYHPNQQDQQPYLVPYPTPSPGPPYRTGSLPPPYGDPPYRIGSSPPPPYGDPSYRSGQSPPSDPGQFVFAVPAGGTDVLRSNQPPDTLRSNQPPELQGLVPALPVPSSTPQSVLVYNRQNSVNNNGYPPTNVYYQSPYPQALPPQNPVYVLPNNDKNFIPGSTYNGAFSPNTATFNQPYPTEIPIYNQPIPQNVPLYAQPKPENVPIYHRSYQDGPPIPMQPVYQQPSPPQSSSGPIYQSGPSYPGPPYASYQDSQQPPEQVMYSSNHHPSTTPKSENSKKSN